MTTFLSRTTCGQGGDGRVCGGGACSGAGQAAAHRTALQNGPPASTRHAGLWPRGPWRAPPALPQPRARAAPAFAFPAGPHLEVVAQVEVLERHLQLHNDVVPLGRLLLLLLPPKAKPAKTAKTAAEEPAERREAARPRRAGRQPAAGPGGGSRTRSAPGATRLGASAIPSRRGRHSLREDVLGGAAAAAAAVAHLLQPLLPIPVIHFALLGIGQHLIGCSSGERGSAGWLGEGGSGGQVGSAPCIASRAGPHPSPPALPPFRTAGCASPPSPAGVLRIPPPPPPTVADVSKLLGRRLLLLLAALHLVRVHLECQLAVGTLDLGIGGRPRHLENVIVVASAAGSNMWAWVSRQAGQRAGAAATCAAWRAGCQGHSRCSQGQQSQQHGCCKPCSLPHSCSAYGRCC